DVDNGILVDRRSATSCPFVYAAGDVANQPGFFGGRARLETFHNAAAQAEAAAAAMLGEDVDACQPCSFWSDQYDFNIQSAGRVRDECRAVVRGSVSDGDFTLFYLADDLLEGVVTVNRPADMAVAKRMIPARRAFDPAALADSSVPLRSLLAKPASS
ncbi:oxidoreductase C-terminal domain-containing protein, partial [Sphingomonas sp. CCH9-H8]|uniref:oxidoreductase C-terminal domain-containing protein n=1 Tax=Sphingomonas sp. CCH9-H8 TaxID=1768772 RepID=UPI000A57E2ED